jgi:hypothetical protein
MKVLKYILKHWRRVWSGVIWLGIEISGGSYEHYNEASGSEREGEFRRRETVRILPIE